MATRGERARPGQDLLLFAAKTMGVAAGVCVVIEDGPLGVTAARAAGMAVLGFAPGGDGLRFALRVPTTPGPSTRAVTECRS